MECCLPFFTLCYPNHVIGTSDVQLGVPLGLTELHQCFLNQWKWVAILDRLLIKIAVVNTES